MRGASGLGSCGQRQTIMRILLLMPNGLKSVLTEHVIWLHETQSLQPTERKDRLRNSHNHCLLLSKVCLCSNRAAPALCQKDMPMVSSCLMQPQRSTSPHPTAWNADSRKFIQPNVSYEIQIGLIYRLLLKTLLCGLN